VGADTNSATLGHWVLCYILRLFHRNNFAGSAALAKVCALLSAILDIIIIIIITGTTALLRSWFRVLMLQPMRLSDDGRASLVSRCSLGVAVEIRAGQRSLSWQTLCV